MSRSFESRRRYVRNTRSIVERARGAMDPSSLLNAAGEPLAAGGIERPTIERLEPRKLLFSVTIDAGDIDPTTGLGTIEGHFAYTIPLFDQPDFELELEPDEFLDEDFNDEDPGGVQSGDVFDGSDILYTASGVTQAAIDGPVVEDNDDFLLLDVSIASTDGFFSFATLADPEDELGPRNVNNAVTFTVVNERLDTSFGNGAGLLNGQLEIELIFNGEVVDTYTQADLTALTPGGDLDEIDYTLTVRPGADFDVFDEVRFVQRAPADGATPIPAAFGLDDLVFQQPVANFADLVEPRIFGVFFTFTAPEGGTAEFLDVYGRDIIETIQLGELGDTNFVLVDPDDDGVPNFNDGLGRINISGTDESSSLVLTGTTIDFFDGDPPEDADFLEGSFAATFEDDLSFFDDFEDAGFGFALSGTDADDLSVVGLPDAGGSVILGSHFVRPLSDYDPASVFIGDFDFSNPEQGIFIDDGSAIGQVVTNAAMFGSSSFTGAVGQLSSAYFLGSASVAGDLGQFYSATDSGLWVIDADDDSDDDNVFLGTVNLTGSQLFVGRTLGEFAVAARNQTDITVDGDLSAPGSAPPDDVLVYDEREIVFGIDLDVEQDIVIQAAAGSAFTYAPVFVGSNLAFVPSQEVTATLFGETYLRNDSYINAEYIGGSTSNVILRGSLGGQDPINTGHDGVDVFAFAADGTQEVVIESLLMPGTFRIQDIDGRTLAAQSGDESTAFGQSVSFTPDVPGVFFLVIHNPIDNEGLIDEEIEFQYQLAISGIAPTTLGSYRVGLGGAGEDVPPPAGDGDIERPSISVLSGSIGSIRVGTGYVDASGVDAFTGDFINTFEETALDLLAVNALSVSTPEDLYSFIAGSDINVRSDAITGPITLSVGRDLGSFYTGRSPIGGTGDLGDVRIDAGGRIGLIDIAGSVATDSGALLGGGELSFGGETFVIRTGLDPEFSGDIGFITIGGSVLGDTMTIDTSAAPGSVIGGLLTNQAFVLGNDNDGFFDGLQGVELILGEGSDLRFLDTPNIDLLESQGASLPLLLDETLEIIDDAGGRVEITVTQAGAFAGQVGEVIVVPADDGEGVVIAQINVDLTGLGTFTGGRTLNITGSGGQTIDDVISIGRINVVASDENASININGPAQIDVWRIDAPEGLNEIENTSAGGDIVAIDTLTLDTLRVTQGSIGRTQLPEFGPRLIGPVLGISAGLQGGVGDAIGVTQDGVTFDPDWNGLIFRPLADEIFGAGNAYLDDIGSPFDDALNGVIVRSGAITLVESNGAIGDVITQGDDGTIDTVRANADGVLLDDGIFEGIVGSIFSSENILLVEVGEGMLRSETGTDTPFAETGIYAEDFIATIRSDFDGAVIGSNIIASSLAGIVPTATVGIDFIDVENGDFSGAFIGVTNLDNYYVDDLFGNDGIVTGDIGTIDINNGDLFGTQIVALDLTDLTISGGFFDASDVSISGEVISSISADGFRNSTLLGETLEFRVSRINVGEDLERLTVTQNGDISDTQITVLGDIESSLSVANLIRTELEVANTLQTLLVSESVLSSSITAGQLVAMTVTDVIQLTDIAISGPIVNLNVLNRIERSSIEVTGPDGRIDLLTVTNDLDADISSSGRIGTIESTMGSITGSIVTTTPAGSVNRIAAAIDIATDTDIAGDLNQFQAGRNIGDPEDPSVVLVRGDLVSLDVSNGRLFSDLRVGGEITQSVMIGPIANLPGDPKPDDGDITVFERINSIEIVGDFDGTITSESLGIGSVTITDGSLLQAGGVIANDGGIGTVTIERGHLLGTIFAEQSINLIQVIASADGAFGDIGINNDLSSGVATDDPNRNQLPPTAVATSMVDGPTIASLKSIGTILVTGGDIIEATIYAGSTIGLIDVTGGVRSNEQAGPDETTVIAAGDLIQDVRMTGSAEDVLFLAGVTSFGDQPIFEIGDPLFTDRAGGVGAEADTLKSGTIASVSIGGQASDVRFVAGITAGDDGEYATGDAGEGNVVGFSVVDEITIAGAQSNVTFSADRAAVFLNGVNVRSSNTGATSPNADGLLAPLTDAFVGGSIDLSLLGTVVERNTTQTFTLGGTSFSVTWNAPDATTPQEDAGQGVIFDASTGTLILANTRIDHEVIVTVLDSDENPGTALPRLTGLDIRSNDEASLGLLRIEGENGTPILDGDTNIVVDNFVGRLELPAIESTGRIVVGQDIGTLVANRIAGTQISANFVQNTIIETSFQRLSGVTPGLDYNGAGSISVAQNAAVGINVDRSITSIDIGGTADGLLLRAGGSLFSFEADEVQRSRLSVANLIGSIDVAGDVFDTAIIAGGDLGTDLVDGDGEISSDVDRVTSGTINTITIGGDLIESDIIAGFLRGGDLFFGTTDDSAAAGESNIGMVTVAGTAFGSNVNSENFGLLSAGSISSAMIDGVDAATVGNFVVGPIDTVPLVIQVESLAVIQDARTYSAIFTFNQAIDESSFLDALQIREVRSEAEAQLPFDPTDPLSLEAPTPGVPGSGDYTITYDAEEFIFEVAIDRVVTDRDLVDNGDGTFSLPDEAAAGVYRFEVLSDVLRGLDASARLDGDGDGFATTSDDFSEDAFVGDAGDAAGPRDIERVVQATPNGVVEIDFFGAANLDLLLDSNTTPDGLAEINTPVTIRGSVGDHPDRNLDVFGFGGDRDVYEITLQAGQILRLGEVSGPANQLQRTLYFQPADGSTPTEQVTTGGIFEGFLAETPQTIVLPSSTPDLVDIGTDTSVLIKQTGVYFIVIESGGLESLTGDLQPAFIPGSVPNEVPEPNQIGNYAFDIEVFDDGDSGFNAGTDSGNGRNLVNAPSPLAFGATFQQDPDTIAPIIIGEFTFRLTPGADGVIGVAEPGDPNDDVVIGETTDGSIISTREFDRLETVVSSSIGTPGVVGAPGAVQSDVDIYHLNSFQPLAAGTLVTITVGLSETGADLGTIQAEEVNEFSSLAEFTDLSSVVQFALFETTNSDDAESADLVFSPTDFLPRAGTPNTLIAQNGPNSYGFDGNGDFFISFVVPPSFDGGNGSYAVYLQGALRSDYQLTVVTQGSGSVPVGPQNVLIEADGGTVDWLGIQDTVEFGGFDAGTLGFAGLVDNVDVTEFIVAQAIERLNGFFDDIGLDVTFSSNPADFEFEQFSTVFVTSDNNPLGLLLTSDFGISERSDPFNTDKEDEAVVFAPDYATLGFNPTPGDLDNFIDSIAAGIGRRVGELVGLRLTDPNPAGDAGGDIDIQNEESIAFPRLDPASNFVFPSSSREIASNVNGVNDTGFFLGDQNAQALLDTILSGD